jgi:hypothetical protein
LLEFKPTDTESVVLGKTKPRKLWLVHRGFETKNWRKKLSAGGSRL